ncbi:MAG: hypothetical protein FJX74_13090 [Armatimonadetes bacterium]|nr:hypothetical protein [Armatimonadota bacterium]
MGTSLLLTFVATLGWAQGSFVGGRGAPWRPLAASRGEGNALALTVEPADMHGGRVLLVVERPPWMALDDASPPRLVSASVNGEALEVGQRLAISADGAGPELRVIVSDDANAVDPQSVAVTMEGRRIAAAATEAAPEGLEASFDLSSIAVGAYEGALEVQDLAPAGNTLRVPLRLTVDGLRRHDDGQTVALTRDGWEYILGGAGRGQGFLRFGDGGPAAYLSTQVGDKFVYARDVVAIEDLKDETGVRMRTDVIGIEGQDFGQIAELEFDVAACPEFPGVLLASRARNLGPPAEVYCFWGWLPGEGFVTAEGEQAWSMTYRDIGNVGWVFLPPTQPGLPGIGVLSRLRFGESRFGTLLLYTDPQRIATAPGEAVEMRLGFMRAEDARAVADAHAALEAAGRLASP